MCVRCYCVKSKTKVFLSFQSAASACVCGTRLNELQRINIVEQETKRPNRGYGRIELLSAGQDFHRLNARSRLSLTSNANNNN